MNQLNRFDDLTRQEESAFLDEEAEYAEDFDGRDDWDEDRERAE